MTAGILAGGKSSRMGENKAFLKWEGQTLVEHLARMLAAEPAIDFLLVSVADAEEYQDMRRCWQERTQLNLVEDVQKGYGPLEGLYQLLSHGKSEWLFVTATDMPGICPRFLQQMLDQPREGVQAVIPRSKGRIHPLCGLYHKSALSAVEGLLCKKEHRVRKLLEELFVRYVDLEMLGIEDSVLENVNTPREYEEAVKKMSLLFTDQECALAAQGLPQRSEGIP